MPFHLTPNGPLIYDIVPSQIMPSPSILSISSKVDFVLSNSPMSLHSMSSIPTSPSLTQLFPSFLHSSIVPQMLSPDGVSPQFQSQYLTKV